MFKKYFTKLFVITIVFIYGGLFLTTANASYPVLNLDFSNSTTPAQLEPGFYAFTLPDSGSTIQSITITIVPIEPNAPDPNNPAKIDARWRWAPPETTPYWRVYRDFLFSRPGGIRVTLSGLLPNEAYEITIWAYDVGSAGDHLADWYANGEFCFTAEFAGEDTPVDEYSNAFTGTTDSDATGQIVLEALPNPSHPDQQGAVTPYGFINALRLSQVNPILVATNPVPEDGATVTTTDVQLQWTPGMFAGSHDVYVGTDFDDVNNATRASHPGMTYYSEAQTPNNFSADDLTPDVTYYWRIDEVNEPNIWKSKVWRFYVPPKTAYKPIPVDGSLFADSNYLETEVLLSWSQAADANSYHVYFGDDFNDVNKGTGGTDKGTVTDLNYDPNMMLQLDKTYYWRVDANDGTTTYPGAVWSFKTSPAGLGTISMDIWENVTGGSTLNLLTEDPRYPDSPTRTERLTSTDSGEEVGLDYGGRIHGWVYVPVTGDYTFYFTSAGQGQLWLSTDEDPNNLMPEPLAAEMTWGSYNSFTNWSDPIPLIGGNRYYIMAIWKDFGAWDHCQVAWKGAGIRDQQIIRGCYVSYFAYNRSTTPYPESGGIDVESNPILRWTPGMSAEKHDVYFGIDFNSVNDANRTNDPCGVLVSQNHSGNYYPISGTLDLDFYKTYYWRIDDVNDSDIYPGVVWSFTTDSHYVVDNFDHYTDRDALRAVWEDGYAVYENGSNVTLSTEIDERYPAGHQAPGPIHQGRDALQLVYDNDKNIWIYVPGYTEYNYGVSYYFSEMKATVDALHCVSDWTSKDVKMLSLQFSGDPDNDIGPNEQMYIAVEDGDGDVAVVKYGDSAGEDANNLQSREWTEWAIALQEFEDANAKFDINDVNKVYIGFGERFNNHTAGGSGVVYFDSIRLYTQKCVPGLVVGDLTGDCIMDNDDFIMLADSWHGELSPAVPTPIIDLDANSLSPGLVTTWTNAGTLSGQFDINAMDLNDNPTRETIDGLAAVTFDGNDYLIASFDAPGGITGANDFTVVMTVFNPTIGDEEWILTWARRGGPAGTTGGVGYGVNAAWGAVVHWNAGGEEPDMGFDGGIPVADMWHNIAVTYNGLIEKVLVDGKLNAVEGGKILGVFADDPVVVGGGYNLDADDPNIYSMTLQYSGSVNRIRVYDEALSQQQLEYMIRGAYSADFNGDNKVDFKDLAMIVDKWLKEELFPN